MIALPRSSSRSYPGSLIHANANNKDAGTSQCQILVNLLLCRQTAACATTSKFVDVASAICRFQSVGEDLDKGKMPNVLALVQGMPPESYDSPHSSSRVLSVTGLAAHPSENCCIHRSARCCGSLYRMMLVRPSAIALSISWLGRVTQYTTGLSAKDNCRAADDDDWGDFFKMLREELEFFVSRGWTKRRRRNR
ncbi:hypothetical protein KCU88_g429, partial [Aureobasidium melanogenum]